MSSRLAKISAAALLFLVVLYIGRTETTARRDAREAIERHARVISNAVWSLDRDGPQDYLRQAIENDHYETLVVTTNDGEQFFSGSGTPLGNEADRLLARLGLIPLVHLHADVRNGGRVIGNIDASARLRTIYADLYALVLGLLLLLAGRLYLYLLAANRDLDAKVRERTRASRENEARFRALIENIADGIVLVDASGVAFFDTDTMGRVLGYPGDEFLGRAISDIVHPDDRSRVLELFAGALAQTGVLVSLPPSRFKHRDGRWVWIEGTAVNRLSNPSVQGVVVSYRDVTPRIEAEQALHKSEEQYRAIVETAQEAIVMADFDGRILLVNRRFCELTGFTKEELLASLFDVFLFPEDRQRMWTKLAARASGSPEQYDLRLRRKDGQAVPVLVSAGPVNARGGSTLGTVALLTDISARQHLEDQLRQAQKLEAVGVLAGGVAHDFNNVLSVILGYAELLLPEFPAGDPKRDDLMQIRGAAERAADLTRQLLAFSRQQVLRPRVVDLNGIVEGLTKLLRRLIGEDIQLVTKLPAQSWAVLVDPGQMEQVLMNLAVNARDAMPDGGTLTVEIDRRSVDEIEAQHRGLTDGPHLLVSVTDTGHGMDAGTKARIFEPFFTTKPVGKGTGLGLATVFGIIRQSGGAIEVDSEPEKGTTFHIWLPLATENAPEAPSASIADRRTWSDRGTILLVEDDDTVRKIAVNVLSRRGYDVIEAPSGGDALVLWETHAGRVDLVLTDMVMPLMGGDELIRRLQRTRPDLRVVFMSGYVDKTKNVADLPASAAFLPKPFTPDTLLQRVREALAADHS